MYAIREDYIHRSEGVYDYEETITDNWQGLVYAAADTLARREGYSSVLDVGCGRGFKLVKHFRDLRTLGLDLPPTVAWLKDIYAARHWQVIDYAAPPEGYELLICADVIEHVQDPDALLEFIHRCRPRHIALSTPDRDLLEELFYRHYLETDPSWTGFSGPPFNQCHLREWSFAEFENYLGPHFVIEEHHHAPREQACQLVIARLND